MFLDGTLSIRRGKTAKEPVYIALGIKPDGRREVLGFWLFGAEGESAKNWEEVLKDLWRRSVREVRTFITDDLPGIEEAIRQVYPKADWQQCVVHKVRSTLSKARKVHAGAEGGTKVRDHQFPKPEAVYKLVYLEGEWHEVKWGRRLKGFAEAQEQLEQMFAQRYPAPQNVTQKS